jgi:hypothetical protein
VETPVAFSPRRCPRVIAVPRANRTLQRILTQLANAAVRAKGSVFEIAYRKLVARMGRNKAIWAIAHRLCRLTWKILHEGIRYPPESAKACQPASSRSPRPRLSGPSHSSATSDGATMMLIGEFRGFSTVPTPANQQSR